MINYIPGEALALIFFASFFGFLFCCCLLELFWLTSEPEAASCNSLEFVLLVWFICSAELVEPDSELLSDTSTFRGPNLQRYEYRKDNQKAQK